MQNDTLVLDTNAVLDWLVFRDPRCAALAQALESRAVQWLATPAMRAELMAVAARLGCTRGGAHAEAASEAADAGWARWAQVVPEAPALPPAQALRCSDASDQKFIDLAMGLRTRWLVSHDRAVLRLRKRALAAGVTILSPPQWPGPAAAPARL
jgi:uncharacterized protein